jgi:uncharacterized membrane protein YedE/YeeE|tara:strand:+ start:288 stop:491 length:204 start_codon:yes stop_codon:yes gene_type:complete
MINSRMWIRAFFTTIIFSSFSLILYLLFNPTYVLEDKFRDLLNIIVGSFLVSFGKVIDFWFKRENDE